MVQVNDTNSAAGPTSNSPLSMRTEVRALIALGWLPSHDKPWRIYPLRGDTFSLSTTNEVWSTMHEVLIEKSTGSPAAQ